MSITMWTNDDPNADTGAMVSFIVAAVIFTAGAAVLYRPLFAAEISSSPRGVGDGSTPHVLVEPSEAGVS